LYAEVIILTYNIHTEVTIYIFKLWLWACFVCWRWNLSRIRFSIQLCIQISVL